MSFNNVYDDKIRARSYSKLDFPGTYYLAYRDLPKIISKHSDGKNALDFGCGTGRSTRFLKNLGYEVLGVDCSEDMIRLAIESDPGGDYQLIDGKTFSGIGDKYFDIILSVFTFDNIPLKSQKTKLFLEMNRVINKNGIIINLVSSPEIYKNEWASFSTKDFPENKRAQSGDKVKIIMKDVEDQRPVEDIIFFDDDYRKIYACAGLEVIEKYKPLGRDEEPYNWINETIISPWVIYVLKKENKK
jgi:ubiquinone/menaquinone biosynthesis C-methylase UbiE